MVKVDTAPVQPLAEGVMLMVAVIGAEVVLVAVKAGILPVPLAARPIKVLLLAQVKVVPDTGPAIVVEGAEAPLQKVWLVMAVTVGMGFMVATTGLISMQLKGEVTLI
jgi:hypothetical protein